MSPGIADKAARKEVKERVAPLVRVALLRMPLAFAMGLSDDVNRRLKAGRTDDQS